MLQLNKLQIIDDTLIQKIHEGTVKVLEEAGVNFENEEAVQILKDAGAIVNGKNVRIPRALLEKSIEDTPKSFQMCGIDPSKKFTIGEGQERIISDPSFGTILIYEEGKGYSKPTMEDLVDCYKLHQHYDLCDIGGGLPVDPRENMTEKAENQQIIIFREMLRHVTKPLRLYNVTKKEFKDICAMYEIAQGTEGYLDENCSFYLTINPLSPLGYDNLPLESMIAFAEKHQAVCLQSCSLTGFTAPMSLLGAAVLQNAEVLAGNVLLQCVRPGTPFLFGVTASRTDMRSGAYVCASPEADLINIASVQVVSKLYNIPTRIMCGITDSKLPDAQAGYESMQNMLLAALSGTNVLHGFGSLDSMNATSHEKFVCTMEIFSRICRLKAGIQDNDEDLSIDEIISTGAGGTYMMNDATLMNCQNTWTAEISTQVPFDAWQAAGELSVSEKARDYAKKIIENSPSSLIDPAKDEQITAYLKKTGYLD